MVTRHAATSLRPLTASVAAPAGAATDDEPEMKATWVSTIMTPRQTRSVSAAPCSWLTVFIRAMNTPIRNSFPNAPYPGCNGSTFEVHQDIVLQPCGGYTLPFVYSRMSPDASRASSRGIARSHAARITAARRGYDDLHVSPKRSQTGRPWRHPGDFRDWQTLRRRGTPDPRVMELN